MVPRDIVESERRSAMKKHRVLVLVHEDCIPPEEAYSKKPDEVEWEAYKTEYDVIRTLRKLDHEVEIIGVRYDLKVLRQKVDEFKPHIVFNLLEEFNDQAVFDQHIVSYLEMMEIPYTGCNPKGLMIARDKALLKKVLNFHELPVPQFQVFKRFKRIKKRKKSLHFPVIVKSLVEEASLGISQASVVNDEEKMRARIEYIHEKIGTDAICESYIQGREVYMSIFGHQQLQCFPAWELKFKKLPDSMEPIASRTVKFNKDYREKYGIKLGAAKITKAQQKKFEEICKEAFRRLHLSGYARFDARLTEEGRFYIIEANPNPDIAFGEEFSSSAKMSGISYEELIDMLLTQGLSYFKYRKREMS